MNQSDVFSRIQEACVVAVLVIDRADDAVPVAEALLAGGVTAMELTLRTPAALDALRRIRAQVPGMLAGVGTVLKTGQVSEVVDAGGQFAVAPGMNPRVVEAAQNAELPFAPGVCTPSDIERAIEYDCRLLKFFPAETSGGLKGLKAIAGPYAHLGLKYIPLGGVNLQTMPAYLGDPNVAGIGGSWIAPRDVIAGQRWSDIEQKAREAIAVRDSTRGK